jgi:predicted CoA-binding protein
MIVSIRDILTKCRTVAVVGLSDDPKRPSQRVASSLKFWGFRVIPVNPVITEAMRERARASLVELPEPPDLVLVFRRPEFAADVVRQAAAARAKAVWFQPGTSSLEAVAVAERLDLPCVAGPCIAKEYLRLFGEKL